MTPSFSGSELIADLYEIKRNLLESEFQLNNIFEGSLRECGFTILEYTSYKFDAGGKGVTGLFLLSESHATYHSYPEFGAISINIFSCGKHDPQIPFDIICNNLLSKKVEVKIIKRHFKYQSLDENISNKG